MMMGDEITGERAREQCNNAMCYTVWYDCTCKSFKSKTTKPTTNFTKH